VNLSMVGCCCGRLDNETEPGGGDMNEGGVWAVWAVWAGSVCTVPIVGGQQVRRGLASCVLVGRHALLTEPARLWGSGRRRRVLAR